MHYSSIITITSSVSWSIIFVLSWSIFQMTKFIWTNILTRWTQRTVPHPPWLIHPSWTSWLNFTILAAPYNRTKGKTKKIAHMSKLIQLVRPSKSVLAFCYGYQINPHFYTYNRKCDWRLESRSSYGHKNKIRGFFFCFCLMKIYYHMILKTAEVDKIYNLTIDLQNPKSLNPLNFGWDRTT